MSGGDTLQRLPESNAEETGECTDRESASRSGGAETDLERQTATEGISTSEVGRSEDTSQRTEGQLHHTDDCGSCTEGPVCDQPKTPDQSLSQVERDPVNSITDSGVGLSSETVEDVSDALTNVHLASTAREIVDEVTPQLPGSQPPLLQRVTDRREEQLQGFENIGKPGDSVPQGPVGLSRPSTLGPMVPLTSSGQEAVDSPQPGSLSGSCGQEAVDSSQPGSLSDSCEESELESGRLSPFLVVSKRSITNVTGLESPGLLYASGLTEKDNRDLYAPPDEVAQDVLEFSSEVQLDSGARVRVKISPSKGAAVSGTGSGGQDGTDVEQSMQSTAERRRLRMSVPIDPGAVLQLEEHAKHVAKELNYMMDNLRNSLHAMTACTVQSIELHRASVDNLHQVVDANVKAMYSFMAKFEELHKNVGPLQEIAAQIREISDNLKILERSFRLS